MSYKLALLVCLAALGNAEDCTNTIEKALFRGECPTGSNFHFYSFTTIKNAMEKSWKEDLEALNGKITQTMANAALGDLARVTDYIDKEIEKLQKTLSSHQAPDNVGLNSQLTQVLAAAQSNTTHYVQQQMEKMEQTMIKWKSQQESAISQMLANNIAEISKMTTSFKKSITDLRNANAELKQKIEQSQETIKPVRNVKSFEPFVPADAKFL